MEFPIGYSSLGGTYAFLALMEEQRLLEKDGIRPAFVYIGGPQISQALIAGDIRMAVLGAASPVRAAAHGAEMRFIGGVTDKENITVIADPKIAKPTELKGTRMAIDRLGDYSDFRARKVLEMFGLEPQKERPAAPDRRSNRALRRAQERTGAIHFRGGATNAGSQESRVP